MSIDCMSWAFRQPLAGNEKVVLLALADRANDQGVCWPGQAEVAAKAYVSEKTVGRIMSKLEDAGYLRRERRFREDGSRTSDLTVLNLSASGPTDNVSAGKTGRDQQTPVSEQEPSEEPSGSLVERAGARVKPVSYRGRKVPVPVVDEATRLCAVFAEVTGRACSPRSGRGDATPALKQVVGAMLTRPDVTAEAWERAIRNTAANPPSWIDGQLLLGHVFGERAADHALNNDGIVRERPARGGGARRESASDILRDLNVRKDVDYGF